MEYYSLILSLYNVSKFSGTSVPLWPKPNETIIYLLLHTKAYSSVVIYCDFCWVPLIYWILKFSSSALQEIFHCWYHCCYRFLHRRDVACTKSKKPLLVWTTTNVMMYNPHMIYQIKFSNINSTFLLPPIPISDSIYWRFFWVSKLCW